MKIGVAFYGDVQQVDGQGISTQFFILGGPLIPLKSMFVIEDRGTQKRGFEIGVNAQSTWLGFARIYTFLFAFLFILLGWLLPRECGYLVIPGIISLGLWIPVQFFTGKPSERDKAKRKMIGRALGINAFPEWLPYDTLKASIQLLQEKYDLLYEGGVVRHKDWKELVRYGQHMNTSYAHIVYTLALFSNYRNSVEVPDELVEKAWNLTTESKVY